MIEVCGEFPSGVDDDALPVRHKRILALAGRNGSGKETVAQRMAAVLDGAKTHTYSDVLRETFRLWGVARTSREQLQALSTFMREQIGQEALAQVMVRRCQAARTPWVVIDGVRRLEDLELLKRALGPSNIVLVWVEASADVRYERMKARKEKVGEAYMTREQFDREEQAETEQMLEAVRAASDRQIDNNGTLEQLEEQLGLLHHDLVVGPV